MKCFICEVEGVFLPVRVLFWKDGYDYLCQECYDEHWESEAVGKDAQKFWDEFNRTRTPENLLHLCDVSEEDFAKKHECVLNLRERYDSWLIGLLLAAECYSDVWASRSCSGYLVNLMGLKDDDYCAYYCQSSLYFDYMYFHPDRELLRDFDTAMNADKKRWKNATN